MAKRLSVKARYAALEQNYILVVTSNSREREAIDSVLKFQKRADIGRDTKGCSLGLLGANLVLHVTGEAGISNERSAGKLVIALLADSLAPAPRLIVLAGFCWGNPAVVKVGQTVISDSLLFANSQIADGISVVPRVRRVSSQISLNSIHEHLAGCLAQSGLHACIGELASAEVLFKSVQRRQELLTNYPDLIGGEMEGFGFLSSTQPWIVVKAVSDLGDEDVSTVHQDQAALSAAKTLLPLLQILEDSEAIKPFRESQAATNLQVELMGDLIEIDVRSIGSDALSDYLNNDIAEELQACLERYVGAAGSVYGSSFSELLCETILEVAHNAFRHGKANKVSLRFHDSRVVMIDDGVDFSLEGLKDGRGGSGALRDLLGQGGDNLQVKSSRHAQMNEYQFQLTLISSELLKVRANCELTVEKGVIGRTVGRSDVFRFDEACSTVFFDVRSIRMRSRRYDIAKAMEELLATGRRVLIGCRSDRDRAFFLEQLRAWDGQLEFVDLQS